MNIVKLFRDAFLARLAAAGKISVKVRRLPQQRFAYPAYVPGTIAFYDRQVREWLEGGRVGPRPQR